ncbi:(deoxy)nucleoside triphosphate pyrophosphohydrolase [Lignipirellula cremea]|uniref:8-oxo-dGTP diphosphatase n=1 Tax=Lignipirellula cremea TaxID=2528010 RepID=A0A518E2U9_9BACT|nr:(deoxy)nucleoside triphosphate pyrophosphohydrolase [Lignipirellula cremea]QDU98419.1 CTP pyrophosphohydrolase [Lignipirellula cremea]
MNAESPPIPIAVAVVECENRFLIRQRPPGAGLAGYWEFPGGKIEPEETPPQAACRECREETGLAIEVQDSFDTVEYAYPHGTVLLHFFHCRPLDPQASIQGGFIWAPRRELARYMFPPANAGLIALLTKSV